MHRYYCTHAFRVLYYAHITAIAESILSPGGGTEGHKDMVAESIGFVTKNDCDGDHDIPVDFAESSPDNIPQGAPENCEGTPTASLIWSTQRLDYEYRWGGLQDWPLYFYVAGVSRVTGKTQPAPNVFHFLPSHPCAQYWKQIVLTSKAWYVPELAGPSIPTVARDPEKRAMLLLLLFKPWPADIASLLQMSTASLHPTWQAAYAVFFNDLLAARGDSFMKHRPVMFSAAYWATRTLAIIQNIDNMTQPKNILNERGLRLNPDAARGMETSTTLLSDILHASEKANESDATASTTSVSESDACQDEGDLDDVHIHNFHGDERASYMCPLLWDDLLVMTTGTHDKRCANLWDFSPQDFYREEFLRHHAKQGMPDCELHDVSASATMPRWSLPAAVDVDLLIEEAHVWDHIAAVPLDQHDSLPDTFSHNLEERSATLALDKAAEWMREGKLNTSEGNLNIKQSIALMVVASWIQDVLEFSWLSTPGPLPALHFILQGGPGTGKTWCSKTSRALILFFLGEGTTLQAAFMHSVARLNAGSTLHSILKVPVGLFTGKTRTLGEKKEEYIALWRRVLALLLDEFSMISSELWYRSSFRCKQVKQQPDMPWGGLTV